MAGNDGHGAAESRRRRGHFRVVAGRRRHGKADGIGWRVANANHNRHHHAMTAPIPIGAFPADDRTTFDRGELGAILSLYGRMVAAGEWRDYGMSFLRDVAVFAVFRRTAEHPIYRIEKRPRLRGRQGQYAVIAMDGQVLRRGADLPTVLRVLERKLIRAVD
jgi:hypothetical protein